MKLIVPGVFNLIKAAQAGTFKGGNVTGDVGLAPYHDLDSKVPADVKTKMNQLTADVAAGRTKTGFDKPSGDLPSGLILGGRAAGRTRRLADAPSPIRSRSRSWRSSPRWSWALSSSRRPAATLLLAYQGLWEGSLGRPRSISDTLVRATPYIFGGLAVALAFKGGLFNIGVEGQIAVGSLASAVRRLRASRACRFRSTCCWRVLAGALAGALWGAIPGVLKAFTGAHEVIVTIMLNYVAINMTSFLLGGPMKDPNPAIAIAQTRPDPGLGPPAAAVVRPAVPRALGLRRSRCWRPSACGGCCRRARSASRSARSAQTRYAARYAGIDSRAHDGHGHGALRRPGRSGGQHGRASG